MFINRCFHDIGCLWSILTQTAICCIEIDPMRRILSGCYLLNTYTAIFYLEVELVLYMYLELIFPHYIADETLLHRIIADNIFHTNTCTAIFRLETGLVLC